MHFPFFRAVTSLQTSWLGLGGLTLLGVMSQPAIALEYQVDTTGQNEVRFISDAPIEDFEGTTSKIDGYIFWQGDTLAPGVVFDTSEVYLEVPLNSLSTGIDMRDRHMRENYLHTDLHPFVSYKGSIADVEKGQGDTLLVRTQGRLDLHGRKKYYEIVCAVVGSRTAYAVDTRFDVKLTDFDIEIPSLMFMKINEVIRVLVKVHVAAVE